MISNRTMNGTKKVFSQKWDNLNIFVSSLIPIFCLVMLYYGVWGETGHNALLVSLALIFLAVPLFFCPISISKDDQKMVIRFLLWSKSYDLTSWKRETGIKSEEVRDSIRIFAIGGYFGYYGLYRLNDGTKFTSYLVNRFSNVIFLTDNKGGHIAVNAPDNWF